MFGFIRRLFGVYTPEENRVQGRKYVEEKLKDTGILFRGNEDAVAAIAFSLLEEYKALRDKAETLGAKAFVDGMGDGLDAYTKRDKETTCH